MKCSLCMLEFDDRVARSSCAGCFKLGGCSMIKCPRCGYESPPEPEWLKRLSRMVKKRRK